MAYVRKGRDTYMATKYTEDITFRAVDNAPYFNFIFYIILIILFFNNQMVHTQKLEYGSTTNNSVYNEEKKRF